MPHASLPAHSRHTWSRVFIVLKSSQCLLRAAALGQEAQLGTLSQCPRAVFFLLTVVEFHHKGMVYISQDIPFYLCPYTITHCGKGEEQLRD